MEPFDAIVLAGGSGRRLGGVDKAELVVGDETLLGRALDAVAAADKVVVVGPVRDLAPPGSPARAVTLTTEDPPGGGPVAAVAAGLPLTEAEIVVVLACDMPFIDQPSVARLADAARAGDAAMLTDADGRRQFLAAAYKRPALVAALDDLPKVEGASMRALTAGLTVTEVVADPETTLDCDTWDDVERSRKIVEER
jgi:molybdopterin-guanine dinucleotide biosynthesis protein A